MNRPNIGSVFGNSRRATILKYNNDGTVLIGLDEVGLQQAPQKFTVPMPSAWTGPDGEFMGGFPSRGSAVVVKQSQGGQWFIDSYIPSRNSVANSLIRPGRALIHAKGGNYIAVDPSGIQLGNSDVYLQVDPKRKLFSSHFDTEIILTEGSRLIDGVVKRDIKENSSRALLGSLDSHLYDDTLVSIAMDPSSSFAVKTNGNMIRNPLLVEKRELNYEFANRFDIGTDEDESNKISDASISNQFSSGRKDSRADTLSLSLQYPNHLMETIKGTVVDTFGNILDLNRTILPIGKIDEYSLRHNSDKSDAFAKIKTQMRKSIAYHFEINAKKSGIEEEDGKESFAIVPNTNDQSNYARNRSRFSIDIDKEGQFKINVPQSSEVGNIPLLTRYENYSNLKANGSNENPNAFLSNTDHQDIFLDSFGRNSIKLSGDDALDGYAAPVDRITGKPIMMGTAFHDILKACNNYLEGARTLNLYEDNNLLRLTPVEKIVEDVLHVSGPYANAGGRSGLISCDGSVVLNLGANTSDRQSLWLDCAGGIVSMIGKDKRNISYAATLDGDMLIQLNGSGIGNTADSRFADQNDAARVPTIDIRVMNGPKPMTIFRIDEFGIRMATEGRFEVTANQGIVMSTQGDMHINGERVAFFTNTGLKRPVERNGIPL